MRVARLLAVLLALAAAGNGLAANPVGWRQDGRGVYPDAEPPTKWSAEQNLRWKAALPGRSHSSPVLAGNVLLVTCEPAELVCLRPSDGQELWRQSHTWRDVLGEERAAEIAEGHRRAEALNQQIEQLKLKRGEFAKAEQKEKADEVTEQISQIRREIDKLYAYPRIPGGGTGNTAATPVSDGKHVWCVFAMGVVACHTLEGDKVWARFVEVPGLQAATSPLLIGDRLVVQFQNQFGLDPATGKTIWQQTTPARTGTPAVAWIGDTAVIANPSGSVVRASDGKLLGKSLYNMPYISPIVHQRILYAHEDGRTTALEFPAQAGAMLAPKVRWTQELAARQRRLGSSVYHDGLLYGCTENGVLDVIDATTGEEVYRQRLPLRGGRVDPSLCIAGDYLFVFNNRGQAVVLRTGKEYEEVSVNDLDGNAATPIFVGKRIYIRGDRALYCVEAE